MKTVRDHGLWFLLVSLGLLASPAWAEKADRNRPIQIEADSVRLDDLNKTAVYEGHVVLSQGTLMVLADRLEVRQDAQGLTTGMAQGGPVHFRQKMDQGEEYADGQAERLEYDGHTGLLRLIGTARLKRGTDELRGNLITYNTRTEVYQAQGSAPGGTSGRVRAVIRPRPQAEISAP